MDEKKYYIIQSRNLAYGLKWLGFDYMKYPSSNYKGLDVYSFELTEEFLNTLELLNKIKNTPTKFKNK